jgi:hypothetical protein
MVPLGHRVRHRTLLDVAVQAGDVASQARVFARRACGHPPLRRREPTAFARRRGNGQVAKR